MNVKIKYDAHGLGEAEVIVDAKDIQHKKGREDYQNLQSFLAGILGDTPSGGVKNTDSQTEKRPHNKSIPHYKADRKLAKIIIDKGGLKHLHGVNYHNKKQMFFFDKVPMVQDIIEQYNVQSDEAAPDAQSEQSEKETDTAGAVENIGSDVT